MVAAGFNDPVLRSTMLACRLAARLDLGYVLPQGFLLRDTTMIPSTGFSLSPGGLLFPYHIGVLASLEHHNHLDLSTALAGSSAGAIAVASHAAQLKPELCLDTTVRISTECANQGGARGRLLSLLQAELDALLHPDAHEFVNGRQGLTGLAYYEVFPKTRPVLQTQFDSREDLKDAILNSSMFPFFSANSPCRVVHQKQNGLDKNTGKGWFSSLPRVVMDGFFTVPISRFGCPDFRMAQRDQQDGDLFKCYQTQEDEPNTNSSVDAPDRKPSPDRTVTVSVFPHESVLMTASAHHDRISPTFDKTNPIGQVSNLLRMATQPLTKEEVYSLYESGWNDAERWSLEEASRGGAVAEALN